MALLQSKIITRARQEDHEFEIRVGNKYSKNLVLKKGVFFLFCCFWFFVQYRAKSKKQRITSEGGNLQCKTNLEQGGIRQNSVVVVQITIPCSQSSGCRTGRRTKATFAGEQFHPIRNLQSEVSSVAQLVGEEQLLGTWSSK